MGKGWGEGRDGVREERWRRDGVRREVGKGWGEGREGQ